jgi:AcrR family transcriptional regulator
LVKSKEEAMCDFILDCSESLFTKHGYKNTSMEMIAEKCDISKPTLYNYFTSKYSLFMGLYTRFQGELMEKGKALMQQGKDKCLIIEEIIDLTHSLMGEKRDFLRMMMRDVHMVMHEDVDEHIKMELRNRRERALLLGEFMKDAVHPELLEEYGVEMLGTILNNFLEGAFWDSVLGDPSGHEKQKKLIMNLLRNGILA